MHAKTYHKLVRDRIPEIIEADGKICNVPKKKEMSIFMFL